MNSRHTRTWKIWGALLVLVSIGLSSCRTYTFTPLAVAEVEDLAESCRAIATEQIEAWISADYERVAAVYTDDIVHFDGGPAYVGVEEVVGMARWMNMFLSDYTMDAGATYISGSDCVGTWLLWGANGLTKEDPRREFDLIETRDGKISFWRLFYGEKFDFSPIDTEFLTRLAEAWTAGDSSALAALYTDDAVLEDSLFGVEAVGPEEIQAYAKSFQRSYSLGSWELVIPFSESENPIPDLQPASGGLYRIVAGRDNCPVTTMLILSTDQEGKIAHQMTLYKADSLIECGWLTE